MLIQEIIEGFNYAYERTGLSMDELKQLLFPQGKVWRLEDSERCLIGTIDAVTSELQVWIGEDSDIED